MAEIVSNIIQNSVGGMVAGAVTTIGGYAGDAVGGIGGMIESAGRSVGEGINRTISGVGSSINSYGDAARRATAASGPSYSSGAQKTAVKKPTTQAKAPKKEPQKALPSTKSMKALPAPPRTARSKSADTVSRKATTTAPKATAIKPKPYNPTPSSYKPTSSSYAAPATQRKPPQADGKVHISAASRPSKAAAPAPKPRLTESNLRAVSGSSAAHIPGYAPSKAPSTTSRLPGAPQKEKGRASVALSKAASVAGTVDRKFF